MEHLPTGQVVRAARAVWQDRTVSIDGAYSMSGGTSRLEGRGLRLDFDFQPSER